ncbi:MAG TPA: hypothetical protein VFY16_04815 [Gemmatimonadaceae bacterium]|nr:hypothetical protein [Gemmatimonadaceae bacterium]
MIRTRIAPLLVLVAACGDNDGPTPPATGSCAGDAPSLSTSFAGATLPATGGGALTCRFTAEVALHGDWAYTSTWGTRGRNWGEMIYVWDVRGEVPLLTDSVRVDGAYTTGDVQVSDDGRLLVVATEFEPGSIVVYDVADDPRRPRLLSRFSSPTTAPGVHTAEVARVNGTLYAFLSVDPGGSAPARLVIVSLADPAAPVEVWSQAMGRPYVHDVFVRDGVLYTALWDDGLGIWDLGGLGRGGSPTAPVSAGTVATAGGNVHNVWWFHDPVSGGKRYAIVGEEQAGAIGTFSAGDIHVVDLEAAGGPREVAQLRIPGAGTHNFWVDEPRGVLYAAYYNGGVVALDLRGDLGACDAGARLGDGRCELASVPGRVLGRALTGGAPVYVWGVWGAGGYVYVSDMLNGLWKLSAIAR